jgi:hypothetical protein
MDASLEMDRELEFMKNPLGTMPTFIERLTLTFIKEYVCMYRTCIELAYVLQTTRELVLDTKVDIH